MSAESQDGESELAPRRARPNVRAGRQAARPTLRDVAALARVSFKTVSRVVNNEPRVRPETAARVQQAIRELGFSRNYMARSLKRGVSSATIGLVVGDVANPFFATIARVVEEVARTHDHLLLAASTYEDRDREREVINALIERRIRGIIVVPVRRDHRYLAPEVRLGTTLVFLDRPPGRLPADVVRLDDAGGARRAVEHLARRGHQRIALLGERPDVFTTAERARGYREGLAACGLATDPDLMRFGCESPADAGHALRELLRSPDPPTAVFATNNRMCIGAVGVLTGDRERIALVGFDDFELAGLLRVPVTVVSYDLHEMGRVAAELLFGRLHGDDRPRQDIVLPTFIVERGSGEVLPATM